MDLWYMDTEFCEYCDELLDDFGQCPNCDYEDTGDYNEDAYFQGEYDGWEE